MTSAKPPGSCAVLQTPASILELVQVALKDFLRFSGVRCGLNLVTSPTLLDLYFGLLNFNQKFEDFCSEFLIKFSVGRGKVGDRYGNINIEVRGGAAL